MKNWIPFAVLGTAVFFLLLMQYILRLNEKIKHQAVKPYLVLTGLHMDIDSKTKEKVLNFEVVNEGEDAASRIVLKVYEASTMSLVHTGAFQKLSVMNGVKYKGNKPNYIEVKCHIYGSISNRLSYIAELEYSDIYEKRYKGTFNVRLDANRLRVIECEEKLEEIKTV